MCQQQTFGTIGFRRFPKQPLGTGVFLGFTKQHVEHRYYMVSKQPMGTDVVTRLTKQHVGVSVFGSALLLGVFRSSCDVFLSFTNTKIDEYLGNVGTDFVQWFPLLILINFDLTTLMNQTSHNLIF